MTIELSLADLKSPDPATRLAAAKRLAQSDEPIESAAVDLVNSLATGDCAGEISDWLHAALERIESPYPAQATELAAAARKYFLEPEAVDPAFWAITLLGRMRADAASAVDVLAEIVDRCDNANLQARAAWALGRIGAAARPAKPHLLRAIANAASPKLVANATKAIDEIGD